MICFYPETGVKVWLVCLSAGPTFLEKIMLDISVARPDSR